jgi:glycosyltransferase involved in cell wall biosynthesis
MDPEDTADMASALLSVIQEGPKGWERQGTAARKRAMEGFTVQRTAEEYVQSYLEVVNQDALCT